MRSARPWVLVALVTLVSCQATIRPPAIEAGRECAGCGMTIGDLRFACERLSAGGWRQYDSIECLLGDGGVDSVWLADYDTRTLAPVESLWVVKGDFPSPMGGGLASFRDRGAADEIAGRTHGQVARLAAFAARGATP